jgi:DNA-binding NtrC family response regulator
MSPPPPDDAISDETANASLDERAAPTRVRCLRVVFAHGGVGQAVTLDTRPVVIGRDPGAAERAIALPDRELSRRHALVEPRGDACASWVVVDLDSRNGTIVGGERLAPGATSRPLGDGDVVRVGKALLLYQDLAAEGAPLVPASGAAGAPSWSAVAMRRVSSDIELCAPRPVPVLVLGETGVGKELVAEQIHRRSRRAGDLVVVNCASIQANLAETELFGHVAGSFTGARATSAGLFAAADGGTLFLDEIGELPMDVQPKLLRALARGEIRAVGSTTTRQVQVRVIAATHRDLLKGVADGTFRADLYARLNAWTIHVPPLRARRDELLALAQTFLARASAAAQLSPTAAEALLLHDWPFNVRELEQVLTAAAVRAGAGDGGGVVKLRHLPAELALRLGARGATPDAVVDVRETEATPGTPAFAPVQSDGRPGEEELRRMLASHGGNVASVAAAYGRDRKQIYRWARRYGLDVDGFRDERGEDERGGENGERDE